MKYMGSKNRIAKDILPIMLKAAEDTGITTWVEPFVGGGNMIDKVPNSFERWGYDTNKYVIDALVAIQRDVEFLPRNNLEFTEEDYNNLRKGESYVYKGYVGFSCSYSGKWLGGWCRDKSGKRDYVKEAYDNAVKQSPKLQNICFLTGEYLTIFFPRKSLIYCDPPYEGTTKYKDSFNHELFWDWVRAQEKDGHIVFVSEYNAPSDFECVWEKEIVSSLTQDTGSKTAVEKLFRLRKE